MEIKKIILGVLAANAVAVILPEYAGYTDLAAAGVLAFWYMNKQKKEQPQKQLKMSEKRTKKVVAGQQSKQLKLNEIPVDMNKAIESQQTKIIEPKENIFQKRMQEYVGK